MKCLIEGQGASREPRRHRVADRLRPRAAKLRLRGAAMPRINLLPWREQERKIRRREFMVARGRRRDCRRHRRRSAAKSSIRAGSTRRLEKNNLLKKEIVQARSADRRHPGSREPQAAPGRAHGHHREAAAQAPGDRASVRRARAHRARRRLSHGDQANRPARSSRSTASLSRAPASRRSCATSTSTWMDNPELQVVEAAKDSPPAARISRCSRRPSA
jgi:hypothetical protein